MLKHRWTTLRITFGYLDCPSCKQEMGFDYRVPGLSVKLSAQLRFKSTIESMAVK